jgi:hypothetical protein
MNVCEISSYILAVALIPPAAGVFANEQVGQGGPYTGSDRTAMTTASNIDFTRFGLDSVDFTNDRKLSARYASPVSETTPVGQKDAVVEFSLAPIVVNSGALEPPPTFDQLMQKFRTTLAKPTTFGERQLASGALEFTTRFGRFCAAAPTGSIQSGIGDDTWLAAPCALF